MKTRSLLLWSLLSATLAACGGEERAAEAHAHGARAETEALHSHDEAQDAGEHTLIDPDVAQAAGVRTAVAASGRIAETLPLYGTIRPDATRVRAVQARYPGTIQRVAVPIGARVAAGAVLATVEANDSLRSYTVTAPIGGLVTRRDAESGQQTEGRVLFEIADFSTVWAELVAFPRDRARLREGLTVRVLGDNGMSAEGRIAWLSPLSSPDSQGVTVRVVLDNADARWTTGQFVDARVHVDEFDAATVVPLAAVQKLRGASVVFVQDGERYTPQPLRLGRRDAAWVEVLEGLAPGARYVVENSYLIKAEIEKSGASHDH